MIVECDGVNTVKDIHGTGVPNDVSGVDGVLVLHDYAFGVFDWQERLLHIGSSWLQCRLMQTDLFANYPWSEMLQKCFRTMLPRTLYSRP